jgi:hypothetical protein
MGNLIATIMVYLAMTTPPYPDLIARQAGLNAVVHEPLSYSAKHCYPAYQGGECLQIDEVQTLIEAVWNREADYIESYRERGWKPRLEVPQPHQMMAIFHLLTEQGALRAGDFTVLHGSLLSGREPETFVMEKDWQSYMKCVGDDAKKDSSCVGF